MAPTPNNLYRALDHRALRRAAYPPTMALCSNSDSVERESSIEVHESAVRLYAERGTRPLHGCGNSSIILSKCELSNDQFEMFRYHKSGSSAQSGVAFAEPVGDDFDFLIGALEDQILDMVLYPF